MDQDLDEMIERELLEMDLSDQDEVLNPDYDNISDDSILTMKFSLMKMLHDCKPENDNDAGNDEWNNLLESTKIIDNLNKNSRTHDIKRKSLHFNATGSNLVSDVAEIIPRLLKNFHFTSKFDLSAEDVGVIREVVNNLISSIESDPTVVSYPRIPNPIPEKVIIDATLLLPQLYDDGSDAIESPDILIADEIPPLSVYELPHLISYTNDLTAFNSIPVANNSHLQLSQCDLEDPQAFNEIKTHEVETSFQIKENKELVQQRIARLNEQAKQLQRNDKCTRIQSWYRSCKEFRKYRLRLANTIKEKNSKAIIIQSFRRGFLARKRARTMKEDLRKHHSAIRIQAHFRGSRNRKEFAIMISIRNEEIANQYKERELMAAEDHNCLSPILEPDLNDYGELDSDLCYESPINSPKRYYIQNRDSLLPSSNIYPTMSLSKIREKLDSLVNTWTELITSCREKRTMKLKVYKDRSIDSKQDLNKVSSSQLSPKPITATISQLIIYWRKQINFSVKPIATLYGANRILSNEQEIHDPPLFDESDSATLIDLGLPVSSPKTVLTIDLAVEGISSCALFSRYTSLERLNLNVNKLSKLDGIQALRYLTQLSVCDNRLESLEGVQHLHHLRFLHADTNRISDISAIRSMPSLITLSLNSNQIASFPDDINLPTLQRLEMSQNKLTHLRRANFKHMNALIYLSFERNQISYIESGTFAAHCDISDQSNSTSGLLLLQTLILSHNSLTSLPNPICLPLLRNLWLSGNKITDFTSWAPNDNESQDISTIFLPMLEKLYLQDNLLCSIPKSAKQFKYLLKLSDLDVSFNKISDHNGLEGLKNFEALRSLQLHDNPITKLIDKEAKGGWRVRALSRCPHLASISGTIVDSSMKQEAHFLSTSYLPESNISTSLSSLANQLSFKGLKRPREVTVQSQDRREFIQLLDSILAEQTAFKTQSSIDKRAAVGGEVSITSAAKYTSIKSDSISLSQTEGYIRNNVLTDAFWDEQWVSLLHNQCVQILHFQSSNNVRIEGNGNLFSDWKSQKLKWVDVNIDRFRLKASLHNLLPQNLPPLPPAAEAATSIQSHWRSYHVRKRLNEALSSVKYVDSELDDIMNDDHNSILADLEGLTLPEPGSLWLDSGPKSMVYGDHRRPRQPSEGSRSLSRRSTSTSDITTLTSVSAASIRDEYKTLDYDNRDNLEDDLTFILSQSGNEQKGKISSLAEEWGIHDPKVAATLARRNKKYKMLAESKERREKDKDPTHRYQQFVKNSLKTTTKSNFKGTNIEVTGSFGGKPKQMRTIKQKQGAIPAWARPSSDNDEVDHS